MNRQILQAFPNNCAGCQRCLYACSAEKQGVFQPSAARLGVHNFSIFGFSAPLICFHCLKPECLAACPEGAITRTEADVVIVDSDNCNGCGDCARACPYGMIRLNAHKKAVKCDLCGGEPACVAECEYQALVFSIPDKSGQKERGRQMKLRSNKETPGEKQHLRAVELLRAARADLIG